MISIKQQGHTNGFPWMIFPLMSSDMDGIPSVWSCELSDAMVLVEASSFPGSGIVWILLELSPRVCFLGWYLVVSWLTSCISRSGSKASSNPSGPRILLFWPWEILKYSNNCLRFVFASPRRSTRYSGASGNFLFMKWISSVLNRYKVGDAKWRSWFNGAGYLMSEESRYRDEFTCAISERIALSFAVGFGNTRNPHD